MKRRDYYVVFFKTERFEDCFTARFYYNCTLEEVLEDMPAACYNRKCQFAKVYAKFNGKCVRIYKFI